MCESMTNKGAIVLRKAELEIQRERNQQRHELKMKREDNRQLELQIKLEKVRAKQPGSNNGWS